MAITNAQKLALYNGALRIIRETKLASLTEEREPRRLLDDEWAGIGNGGAIKHCLEYGIWHFAKRTVKLTYNNALTPNFGLRRVFDQPTDFVRLVDMCSDEHFASPVLRYRTQGAYWFADLDDLYMSYISKDDDYGQNPLLWPEVFIDVVESHLAWKIALGLTVSDGIRGLAEATLDKAKLRAKALGAMGEPTRFTPPSSWELARGGGSMRRDRGSRGSLIG